MKSQVGHGNLTIASVLRCKLGSHKEAQQRWHVSVRKATSHFDVSKSGMPGKINWTAIVRRDHNDYVACALDLRFGSVSAPGHPNFLLSLLPTCAWQVEGDAMQDFGLNFNAQVPAFAFV